MKRKPTMAEILKAAEPIIKKRTEEASEMVTGIGKEIIEDQAKWLDDQMKDILTPRLYAAGLAGDLESEIEAYMQKHSIKIVFIPDRLALRIMIGGRVHSQFIPQITVDGEAVELKPPLDSQQN